MCRHACDTYTFVDCYRALVLTKPTPVPFSSQICNECMCCRVWELASCEPLGTAFRLTAGWGSAGGGTTIITVLPWQHTATPRDSQWGPGDVQQASCSCCWQPRYFLSSQFGDTRRLPRVCSHAVSLFTRTLHCISRSLPTLQICISEVFLGFSHLLCHSVPLCNVFITVSKH
jgi:hypothetical protein